MAVMMNPREKWTDERLDDLTAKVDKGFLDLKAEMKEGFEQVDKRFDRMEDRFDSLNRTLIGAAVALAVAFIGSTATLAGIALL